MRDAHPSRNLVRLRPHGLPHQAAHGAGRGKEVIAVARGADAILIVLDAGKEGLNRHREILEKELETVGIRLNQKPPDVTLTKRKSGGGVRFASTVPQTKLGPDPEKVVTQILREYKITSADVLAREEITVDQLVDVIQVRLQLIHHDNSNLLFAKLISSARPGK